MARSLLQAAGAPVVFTVFTDATENVSNDGVGRVGALSDLIGNRDLKRFLDRRDELDAVEPHPPPTGAWF